MHEVSGKILVRALRDIKAEEELGIDYCAIAGDDSFRSLSLEKRRSHLEAKRGFVCICTRCKREYAELGWVARLQDMRRHSAGGLRRHVAVLLIALISFWMVISLAVPVNNAEARARNI